MCVITLVIFVNYESINFLFNNTNEEPVISQTLHDTEKDIKPPHEIKGKIVSTLL